MFTPMTGGGGSTTLMPISMLMPSPAVGADGLAQTPMMAIPPPGSVLANDATMSPLLSPLGGMITAGGLKAFKDCGEVSRYLYHSPHSMFHGKDLYPTALHLFEARKFLDHRPDLADRIRRCKHVEEVIALSAELAEFTQPGWGDVVLSTVNNQLLFFFLSTLLSVCWLTCANCGGVGT
jgi:hypothetical protein